MRTLIVKLALCATIGLALAAGCGEDGVTSKCPAVPPYDVNDAAAGAPDPGAADPNCFTPIGHAVSPGSGGGSSVGSSGTSSSGSGGTSSGGTAGNTP
ncbi:MAG TPA: hypothetical protein VGI10_26815 [Polyangiaceae bacterium]|jgi:uncharacterized membrane protein YgcG